MINALINNYHHDLVSGPVHAGHVCVPLHLGGLPRRVSDLPGGLAGHDHQRADERVQI